ncbi:bacillibactin ABC transporter integral membrane protein [Natranaerovirga hydrolytica]|uniref:Bacillibactin ABC transporter integral membrane protein n=1 Tax=Natranaerovirga hydrolytica TaxID=680378 RepID=A0A4V2Q0D0_9FIRM|nr:iron ABC transporter permease [Natranaerovirga hydrolytica]TCK93331.1 bacillibactin ABC transporter integral membrane protein [Natranaerovirga hydrolytica]
MFKKDSWHRFFVMLLMISVLIVVVFYISITNGTYDMSVSEVIRTLLGLDTSREFKLVVFEFRLPRIITALLVGLGLSIAGLVVQGITKNPLADPGIMGINSGAGLAIIIFMYFFQGSIKTTSIIGSLSMPFFGLVGGLASALLIYVFAWKGGRLDSQRLILCGIAIGSGLGALSLFLSLKMSASDFEMASVWINGSIWNANWRSVYSIVPWFVVLLPIIIKKAYVLDLFQLEESSVKSLGISTEKEKAILLLACIGLISSCVSVSGNIGFVGLIAPHIAKRLVGIHHHKAVFVCGAVGMLMVLLSDYIGRTFFQPVELPVGIIVSLIGVPYFVYLLFKGKV